MKYMQHILFYLFLICILVHITCILIPFPEFTAFKAKPYSPVLLDRDDRLLQVIPLEGGERREYTSLDEISPGIRDIFIQSEDKRFFHHPGVDPVAVIRSLSLNYSNREIVSGASTISMQLARLIVPHKRGIPGKLAEMVNALRLEARSGKKELLELWLNSLPFGKNTTGIGSAARVYFHKKPENLTTSEACILAVIARNPSFYNPFHHPERFIDAAGDLASRIQKGRNTGIENEIAQVLEELTPYEWPSRAPHFSLYVGKKLASDQLDTRKPLVTSLDLDLNTIIEKKIRGALERYREKRLTNGAALVLHNQTGEILAYVGSHDFYDEEHAGQIDALHIRNQPGSCLKPFLYAYALEKGFYPNTILPDIPSQFGTDEVYTPQNFNNRFHGPVRLRVALASSLNVPAVYLITRLGVENFRQTLVRLGFHSLSKAEGGYGSGLALGNAGVTLFELTRGFSMFPSQGVIRSPVWEYKRHPGPHQGERIFSSYASAMICHILSDNASRALGFTTNSVLNTDFPAMFKTGTSDQFGNIWALGATPTITVGVWLGNVSGKTVIGMPGSSIPARIVKDIISLIDKQPGAFPLPVNAKKVTICTLSGGLATDVCPGTLEEYLPLDAPVPGCNFHHRENGRIKIQYPPLYNSWARDQQDKDAGVLSHSGKQTPFFLRPAEGECFYYDPSIPGSQQGIVFEIIHTKNDETLCISVNKKKEAEISFPYTWFFPLKKGEWTVMVTDGQSSDTVTIVVK